MAPTIGAMNADCLLGLTGPCGDLLGHLKGAIPYLAVGLEKVGPQCQKPVDRLSWNVTRRDSVSR